MEYLFLCFLLFAFCFSLFVSFFLSFFLFSFLLSCYLFMLKVLILLKKCKNRSNVKAAKQSISMSTDKAEARVKQHINAKAWLLKYKQLMAKWLFWKIHKVWLNDNAKLLKCYHCFLLLLFTLLLLPWDEIKLL